MSDLANILKQGFKDKDYRHGYADEFLNSSIATQIKVLREQHGWSQKELAKHAQMKQPRISVMENVNYSSWSINILRKLAEAFELTLCVSFESFGKRLADIERFSREALERFSFEDDPVFAEKREEGIVATTMAIAEAHKDLARSNKIPTTDLAHRKVVQIAAYQNAKGQFKGQNEEMEPSELKSKSEKDQKDQRGRLYETAIG